MKRLLELTNTDLALTPIWRYEGASDDDAVISPSACFEAVDVCAYIARTRFVFADGSEGWGYCSPTEDSGLDYIQPVLITPEGWHVRFWCKEPLPRADSEQLAFPVRFECMVPCDGQRLCGTLAGFTSANA